MIGLLSRRNIQMCPKCQGRLYGFRGYRLCDRCPYKEQA